MNDYQARIEAKRERYAELAEKNRRESESRFSRAKSMGDCIPFGQPILVGHHSEKRDRAFRNRIWDNMAKGSELSDKASYYSQKAASVGTGGISSDDPEAVDKLREKLAGLEKMQENMKAANAAWRKAGNKAGRQPDGTWVDGPYQQYQLQNNNGNMGRIRERILSLVSASQHVAVVKEFEQFTYKEDTDLNRVQLLFAYMPSEDTRKILKGRGFRWSPTYKAWQRQLNRSGVWAAEWAIKEITGEEVSLG